MIQTTLACAVCGFTHTFAEATELAAYKLAMDLKMFSPVGLNLWVCNGCNAHMEAHHEGVPGMERR